MVRRYLVAVLGLMLTAGLSVTACSDDSGGGGGDGSDGGGTATSGDTDNGTADGTTTGDATADGGGTTADGGTSGGDDAGSTGGSCKGCIDDKYKVDEEKNCENSEIPRCNEDANAYEDWGPASAVTSLEITSDDAKDCCFDLDGDGNVDNILGTQVLSLLSGEGPSIDQQIQASLTFGEFIILTEHQGLTEIGQDENYQMNFHLGEFGSGDAPDYVTRTDSECSFEDELCEVQSEAGHEFLINPQSFDEGTHPQASVPDASFEGSNVDAGPGKVVLNLAIESLGNLSLTINGATIDATVDEGASNLEDGTGVVIEEGQLGGYVLLKDLIGLLNNLFTSCECLDNPEESITYPLMEADDPDVIPADCDSEDCQVACVDEVDGKTGDCGGSSANAVCENSGIICGVVGNLTDVADLDVDGDGTPDALSIGALFDATGAQITGVSPFLQVEDQTVSDPSEVTVQSTFFNEAGWVVVHADNGGSPGEVLGFTAAEAGWNNDVSVSLSEDVSDGDTLHGMLHTDNGDGEWAGADDDPIQDALGNVLVQPFEVSTQ